ncbi:hypothetical protein Holit_03040 [Hollandina sp. SP2]
MYGRLPKKGRYGLTFRVRHQRGGKAVYAAPEYFTVFYKEKIMARPVTIFTGQWADLTFDVLSGKIKSFGYDCTEIAC